MLRTSPGDSGSSLPVEDSLPVDLLPADSLQPLSDSPLEGQISIEGDRTTATSPIETFVDDDCPRPQREDNLSAIVTHPPFDASITSRGVHTAMETSAVTVQSDRQTAWSKLPSQDVGLDGLYALRQAAALQTPPPSRTRLWSQRSLTTLTDVSVAESIDLLSFAAPLSPLRERDLAALSEFFRRDDMATIEADLSQRLISLLPEPCWEDEVFDFLKEFL